MQTYTTSLRSYQTKGPEYSAKVNSIHHGNLCLFMKKFTFVMELTWRLRENNEEILNINSVILADYLTLLNLSLLNCEWEF